MLIRCYLPLCLYNNNGYCGTKSGPVISEAGTCKSMRRETPRFPNIIKKEDIQEVEIINGEFTEDRRDE